MFNSLTNLVTSRLLGVSTLGLGLQRHLRTSLQMIRNQTFRFQIRLSGKHSRKTRRLWRGALWNLRLGQGPGNGIVALTYL